MHPRPRPSPEARNTTCCCEELRGRNNTKLTQCIRLRFRKACGPHTRAMRPEAHQKSEKELEPTIPNNGRIRPRVCPSSPAAGVRPINTRPENGSHHSLRCARCQLESAFPPPAVPPKASRQRNLRSTVAALPLRETIAKRRFRLAGCRA